MIYTLTLNPALDLELTVPGISMDQVLWAESVQTDIGGKGFNVSRALLALGAESIAVGFIGGTTGEQLDSGLSQMGIQTNFVRIRGETRTNVSVVDTAHTHYIKVNEPGPLMTDSELSVMLEKISSLSIKGDWWIIAGSTPPGIQTSYIVEIIRLIQSSDAHVVLDMDGPFLYAGCLAGVFLVKPNAIEAGVLVGREISTIETALNALPLVHKLNAQQVAISLGKLGGVYSNGCQRWWARSPMINEHNPIGAGDAMLAGLVWAIQKELEGGDVLKWGIACGAAAASLDGTEVGSYTLVESMVSAIRVEKQE
jgi:1-phosphofructokinase family hexose kinase